MQFRTSLIMSGVLILLSACAVTREQLAQVGKLPELNEVIVPSEQASFRPLNWPEEPRAHSLYPNSLWQPGSYTFFKDHRARRIGDILRVQVEIDDKAQLDDTTSRSRSSSNDLGVPNLFGLEDIAKHKLLPNAADTNSLISMRGSSDHNGEGKIDRKEKIETEVAAMVTQILPNGNLVISGKQEIRVNYEIREISVGGIVRPQDISADNTILYSKIAEARISYGGRGRISEVQQPRIGNQILDIISPF